MKQNNFDFLRFLFAFIVVIGHLIELSQVKVFQSFTPFFNPYFSITGFFIISGFLITASFVRTENIRKYFKKRAFRLLPAYIMVITLSVTLLFFIGNLGLKEYVSNYQLYKYLAANLSFLNFVQPCLPGVFDIKQIDCAVNGALWTLKVEVSFYLIVPLLVYLLNKTDKKYIFLIIIYFISVVYRNLFLHLSELKHDDFYSVLSRQLPGAMMYFASGMILYYYFNFFDKNKILFLFLGIPILIFERYLSVEYLTPVAFSFVIFSIAFGIKYLNNFGKYGDISYGIYIFHCPIIKTLVHFDFYQKNNPYFAALFTLLLIVGVGFTSWHFLEKKWLKKVRDIR